MTETRKLQKMGGKVNELKTDDQWCSSPEGVRVQNKKLRDRESYRISHVEFLNLKQNPLRDNELIAENVELMYCDSDDIYHCLLIYDDEQGDGSSDRVWGYIIRKICPVYFVSKRKDNLHVYEAVRVNR